MLRLEENSLSVISVNSVAIFSSFGARNTPCNDIAPWRSKTVWWLEKTSKEISPYPF
jgi:hypothetical protein